MDGAGPVAAGTPLRPLLPHVAVDVYGLRQRRAVDGQREAGAAFTVRLPAAAAVQPGPAPARAGAPVPDNRCRVLLVDDNQHGAELLADSMRALGYTVDVAFDGPAALQIARSFAPDVALLDLGLPVMDGFELAERLRTDCGLDGVPLIAITGYAQDIDRQRTASRGFRGHLAKPVDVHVLDEMIRKVRPPARESAAE